MPDDTELQTAVKRWREVQQTLADDEPINADMKATGGELRLILDYVKGIIQQQSLDQ